MNYIWISKCVSRLYELPTNLQNFMQKDLAELKIFQKKLGGGATFVKRLTLR